jgi:tetratricopeptide (TPR) repeat protein
VDQACARFEDEWRQGRRPRLEEFLSGAAGAERTELLRELLRLERHYRGAAGERVVLEDYERRFPADAALVRAVLQDDPYRTVKPPSIPEGMGAAPGSAPTAWDAGDLPPRTVGDYDIVGELGHGGMGVVYKAVQRKLKRTVALKMIVAERHTDPQLRARFDTEARAAARLRHPNIIQVHEVGTGENGCPFFSLEFADGGSLDQRLQGTPQPARLAAELVTVLARAVQFAHERGVLHRDLKPANVLLFLKPDRAGTVNPAREPLEAFDLKITDFGLAKLLDGGEGHTQTEVALGTPPYMAPEQTGTRGKEVGPRTDVYALAAILYKLLTGRPPFQGATALETMEQVRSQEPVPPGRLQPKVARDLETICLKGLSKEPARRYATAADLADDLQRWLDGRPIHARRAGVWERGWKYARRKPWVVATVAASVAAVLSLVVGGAYYLHQREYRLQQDKADLERELSHQGALQDARVQAGTRLATAAGLLDKRDWRGAEDAAGAALLLVRAEPELADLREQADHLKLAAGRVRRFIDDRHEAIYYAVLAQEYGEKHGYRQKARTKAREGLAEFGLTGDAPLAPDPFANYPFPPAVKEWLTESCYEMYLIWAGALAPLADAAPEERLARASEALRLLDRAKELRATTHAWHECRAELLQAHDEPDAARQEQKQADDLPPSLAVDDFLLGLAYSRVRDLHKNAEHLHKAEEHLKAALKLQPDHFWASYCLAACYLRENNLPGYVAALDLLSACVQMRPDAALPYLQRGFAYGKIGAFAAAFADYAKAEQLAADDLSRYVLHVNRGAMLYQQGAFGAAADDLAHAVKLPLRQPQAHLTLAQVLIRLGRSDESLAQMDRAIELAPTASLFRTRAGLHEDRKDYPNALTDLERASWLAWMKGDLTELASDQLQRGQVLLRRNEYKAALRAFDFALAANPRLVKAHQLRGETLVELHRIPEAVAAFDRYLARGPPSAAALRSRGVCRLQLHDSAGAVEDLTVALEQDRVAGKSADPLALAQRGWAYLSLNQPAAARRDFEAALLLARSDKADCYAGRGSARVQMDDWQQAVEDAEAARKAEKAKDRTLYRVAWIYARAAGRSRTDPALRGAKGEEQARTYLGDAMERLRAACWMQPTPTQRAAFLKRVEEDPAFQALSNTPDFARLKDDATRPVNQGEGGPAAR